MTKKNKKGWVSSGGLIRMGEKNIKKEVQITPAFIVIASISISIIILIIYKLFPL